VDVKRIWRVTMTVMRSCQTFLTIPYIGIIVREMLQMESNSETEGEMTRVVAGEIKVVVEEIIKVVAEEMIRVVVREKVREERTRVMAEETVGEVN
jgi:hypothetical protein